MCGIAGFVGDGDHSDLEAMVAALGHRGPDDQGCFVDPATGVHLGATRLAVIDRDGGRQPMQTTDGRLTIVFNGEIYNHLDLRRTLEGAGHRFRSDHSDTEALLHGYERWGEALPERLNGMFAFAIFDRPRRRIFLARDRFGEKPLYYAELPGGVMFASELTALRAHSGFRAALDPAALRKYFAYGFFPAPATVFRNTAKLPHGHSLTIDLAEGRKTIRRYWRYEIEPPAGRPAAEDDLAAELRHLLRRAVERRLMSDVPVGVFLSGGLDSSAVAAMAAGLRGGIETFCLGFDEPSYDESGFARRVADRLGTRHRDRRLGAAEALSLLPEVLDRLDEPLGDPSILPTFLLCRFARERVTVALGGDGGDELFAGYDPFAALRPARLATAAMPKPLLGGLLRIAEQLPVSPAYMAFDFRLRRALRGLRHRAALWNPVWLSPLEPDEIADLFGAPVAAEELYSEAVAAWDDANAPSDIDRSLEFYANFYLPEAVLTKADRASMMVSLEYRAPFLDNDLVDFARRLPSDQKMRGGQRKYLLRKAMAGLLPDDVVYRRKQGFGIPLTRLLVRLRDEIDGMVAPMLDGAAVRRLTTRHFAGRKDQRLFLWCLLSLSAFGGGGVR